MRTAGNIVSYVTICKDVITVEYLIIIIIGVILRWSNSPALGWSPWVAEEILHQTHGVEDADQGEEEE